MRQAVPGPRVVGEAAPGGGPGRLSLTRTGLGVIGAGLVFGPAGWATGYRDSLLLGLGCLLAAGAALAWVLPSPGVTASRTLVPPRTERGGRAVATVQVVRTGKRARRGLQLSDGTDDQRVVVRVPVAKAGTRIVADYEIPTPRRGIISVGPLELVVRDPFGLFQRAHRFGAMAELVVRPRMVRLPVPASGRDPHLDGTTSNAVNGATSAFHALRAYVAGDDRRLVHWRSSARTGVLMVRQMADVSRPHTTVLLDTDPMNYTTPQGTYSEESFELAVDVSASVAGSAALTAFPVRLHAGAEVLVKGDSTDAGGVLDALAEVSPGGGGGLGRAISALTGSRGGGSLVVVTSVLAGAAPARMVSAVHGNFDRVLVIQAGSPLAGQTGRTAPAAPAPGTPSPRGGVGVFTLDTLDELPLAWKRMSVG
ncbi:DUF58 domain-containing protein [Streptodolium elevatio]|uniref:DUF58 domain-containing protein n=1 Tax=Streptodolium elevatio TaxID=3157996 RepID=A0ABV3DAM7_9ACTN